MKLYLFIIEGASRKYAAASACAALLGGNCALPWMDALEALNDVTIQ